MQTETPKAFEPLTPHFRKIAENLEIVWTAHAVVRVQERFGFRNKYKIPVEEIQAAGATKSIGDVFRVRCFSIRYVCVRVLRGVRILTVFRTKKKERKGVLANGKRK